MEAVMTTEVLSATAVLYEMYSAAFIEPRPVPLDPDLVAEAYRELPGGSLLPVPPARPAGDRGWFGHNLSPDGPPYETQYGKSDVFHQTRTLADLAGYYRAFGVNLAAGDRRPDHLPVELEFAALLCWKEISAREVGNEESADICRQARKKFVGNHLGRWIPSFAEAVEKKGGSETARLTVKALSAFVAWEAEQLGVDPMGEPAPVVVQESPDDRCHSCFGGEYETE